MGEGVKKEEGDEEEVERKRRTQLRGQRHLWGHRNSYPADPGSRIELLLAQNTHLPGLCL
jgi:hypothetical protein